MTTPTVSALIISYNREDDLRECIASLFATGWPSLEVIVVDNASKDGAAAVAESFEGVKVVRNAENLGFAEAVNQAYALSTGDYVALVNNDAVVAPDWFASLVAFLEARPDAAAAAGKVYFWDEDNPLRATSNRYWSYTTVDPTTGFTTAHLDTKDAVREVATLSGALVMIRRRAIEDVGRSFLEPTFFTYYEETDFFARCIRRGWRLWYTGAPAGWHRMRASSNSRVYPYHYHMERNRLLFAWRNLPEDLLNAELLRTTKRAARLLVSHPVGGVLGKDEAMRAQRDAWQWVLRNRALLERQRHETLRGGARYDDVVEAIDARASYYGHERPEVAALVPASARYVVDVGCAAGHLGAALKRARPGLEVRGVEPTAAAEDARRVLDDVLRGGAEDAPPADWPSPDCVVFADVLEHLVDPWATLRAWHDRLEPGGTLVLSIPNVGHRSVVRGLLGGRFRYVPAGILDRTHLRFFTRASTVDLIEQAGFRVVRFERVLDGPRARTARLARVVEGALPGRTTRGGDALAWASDLDTVQFLFVAERPK
ncbi:MAG: glycosyltransferase [Deltaproteobacteria bacterium]|nr:glycosyltransferase [Deltaproteobacteria bacterium]